MTATEIRVVLVDDLRSFVDGRRAAVARTSAAGVDLLNRYRDQRLDELWLDHDLGEDDTIWPVVEVSGRAAFDDRSLDIGVITVHSANPAGAAKAAVDDVRACGQLPARIPRSVRAIGTSVWRA